MRKKFEEWERAFIYLTYPNFNHKEIANYLHRSPNSILSFRHKTFFKKNRIFIGQEFGKLTVKYEVETDSKRGRKWMCLCKCGRKKAVFAHNLLNGNTKSCRCRDNVPPKIGAITGQWYNRVKKTALKSQRKFDVDMDFLNELWNKQEGKCSLSGLKLYISENNGAMLSTASLDRIDSNKDYTKDNVQIIYVDLNFMKREFDQDYFIALCNLVAKNSKKIGYKNENCFQRTRKTHRKNTETLTCNGETLTMNEWANKVNIKVETIRSRLKYNWTIEKALFTPLLKQGK